MTQSDIRETPLYRDAEALFRAIRQPGGERISDAGELCISPDGRQAVFAGVIVEALEGGLPTRICAVDLKSGGVRVLTGGPHSDRLPKYSPQGDRVAFLSDRHQAGDFQLHLLDPSSRRVRATPAVDGWVEYLHWSPDGTRVLLGVAGHGADTSSGQGAIRSKWIAAEVPSWVPTVHGGEEDCSWRSIWIYEVTTQRLRQVVTPGINVWESVWCGNQVLAAVISGGPTEGFWYEARVALIDWQSEHVREIYKPEHQIGCLSAAPSGQHLAIVEAVCSDRGFIAGQLKLMDTESGEITPIQTDQVDVACSEWRSELTLLLAGHRGLETVIATYHVVPPRFAEIWCSRDMTTAGLYASVAGMGDSGDCVVVSESFTRAPEIAVIRHGEYRRLKSLAPDPDPAGNPSVTSQCAAWTAPDGLEIQGWVLRPVGVGPHPLVMWIHGGPVWHWRARWLGRANVPILLLLAHGYAVFLPNPRGSDGRGQEFARRVLGDMGGADTLDFLSGIDYLVERGIADSTRLGVIGVSYGGFMACWLITQDARFSAAISVAPVTHWVSEHLTSNIPQWVASFLADSYCNPNGKYFQRSPIMHAHKAKTSTLNICGALDRSAPPAESVQFHNALLENGVESVLVTYPEEGHGVRTFPALIDYTARVVSWFEEHV